jgi:predicted secreted hydrolase
MKKPIGLPLVPFVLASAACAGANGSGSGEGPTLRLAAEPSPPVFARATSTRLFHLPADHGPHFEYQTEWWYYTGNLTDPGGRHFGYQLTFFRRGLSPGPPPAGPGLATNQIYFAHLAITDSAAGRHAFAERWSRGAGDLAGAVGEPFAVWLEGWRVESRDRDGSSLHLEAREGALALDLELAATRPLVAHGDRGLSPKSDEPGNASYYVGYTRLRTRGRITTASGTFEVTGASWFDHEWSTSALGKGAVGWDWFSLQTSDERELMFFRIRREDGSFEPVSGGTLVEPDGRTRRLALADVRIEVEDRWTSPDTGASYPSRWKLEVPSAGLELRLVPWVSGQELRTSFTYWEGAVRVEGTSAGKAVVGNGYVEMTGYAKTMQGVF